jgi:signal transduction histidine kinase
MSKDIENRTDIINALLKLFLHTDSRKEFLDESLKIIRDWVGTTCAGIRVADEQGNIPYVSHIGFSEQFIQSEKWLSTKRDQCACIRVILGDIEPQDTSEMTQAGSFCCNDTLKFLEKLTVAEKSRFRGVCIQTGYQSVAVVPIQYGQKILGAIHLADKRDGVFTRKAIEFVESSIAPLIGEGVYRFNVEDQLQHNLETQTVLTSLLRYSLEDLALEEILNLTLDLIHSSRSFSFGHKSGIFLVEDEPDVLVMRVSRGFDEQSKGKCARIHFGTCLCGRAALKQEIQFADNLDKCHEIEHDATRPHSHYCVPIQFGKTILGVINLYLEEGHRRDQREEEFLSAVANTLAGIIWRQRSEEKLRTLSRRLVSIQEEERRAVALELHDQIGQLLTGLKLVISQATRSLDGNKNPALKEAQTIVSDLIVKVREMSLNLRPSMLDDLGLLPTLLWHFQQCKAQSGLNVDFRHSGLERNFPKDVNIAAYRIIQEALTNIMRYAGVSDVSVNVWADNTALHIKIEDKGIGFKTTEVSIGTSVGLQGMRERAILLGGNLTIESSPGVGTLITAELPLQDKPESIKTAGI